MECRSEDAGYLAHDDVLLWFPSLGTGKSRDGC